MKKDTRDKMTKIFVVFIVIMFIVGLLPMIFGR
ncbi:DUF4044 domain-containing protein [Clostridium tyrobutyricum]|jgi:hypothetical protein|nr:hypothetical protein [Clostridium tyrobutyricum]MBR9647034.1 DUF4044 domain-containing protein [Clostridium tyrobutyricum]MBV4414898.1 DUF4044 domain-containing protein [Clostridium tyrobutyricum]MBV4418052.1 DUF4044 domain-containing protein [Clostridium tyrobutyricum]MBV4420758.1 DUF4044 domain-containing protein [Clostridium tyrobutyricum]MBV4423869.1 DUF4044 domain-containing protein [Clostridium tyrobutyricum]